MKNIFIPTVSKVIWTIVLNFLAGILVVLWIFVVYAASLQPGVLPVLLLYIPLFLIHPGFELAFFTSHFFGTSMFLAGVLFDIGYFYILLCFLALYRQRKNKAWE